MFLQLCKDMLKPNIEKHNINHAESWALLLTDMGVTRKIHGNEFDNETIIKAYMIGPSTRPQS